MISISQVKKQRSRKVKSKQEEKLQCQAQDCIRWHALFLESIFPSSGMQSFLMQHPLCFDTQQQVFVLRGVFVCSI